MEEKMFEIWSEGFAATGESAGAYYHGVEKGKTFKGACIKYAEKDSKFYKYFDSKRMTLWGCRLFDNGHEARKSYG